MSTAVEATSMRDRETGASALTLLLMSATVLTGLMAGFFYAFACSVMVGLARTDDYTFVAAGAPDQIADLAGVRDDFEGPWVTWNLVRTVFATGALAALCAALLRHPAERG
jgi:uncharacterized membrane protein